MANTTLTASIVAKAALGILENELTMANAVYRGYEDEFEKKVNGYEVGDTITIRKPTDFTVRNTITASPQDVTEAKLTLSVNQIAGVDFKFTSQQLTLNISQLAERVIRPAMIQIANQIDVSAMALLQGHPAVGRHAWNDAQHLCRLRQGHAPISISARCRKPAARWFWLPRTTGRWRAAKPRCSSRRSARMRIATAASARSATSRT